MLALSQRSQQCKHGYLTGREAAKVAKRKSFDPSVQARVLKILDISYSHSVASILTSRHSSCAQFSVPSRAECRQVTPCRVSSASGTKAGTTLKTFFKLRALSFCFCPKGHSEPPLEARYRRKRPFRNSTALLPASRQLQSQVNQRGRLSCWLKNRRSQLFVVRG